MSAMLDAALGYAAKGWPVFPLKPREKVPATAHGVKDATTDEATIRAWWGKTPDANVGYATGNGVAVVDIDDLGSWTDLLEEAQVAVPDTSRVETSRGWQLYFRTNEPIRNSAGKLKTGLDVRGDGGYTVLPPSVHPSGHVYRWGKNGTPDEMPAWLLERLTAERPQVLAHARNFREAPIGGSNYGRAALEDEAANVADAIEGSRNHTLNVSALKLGSLVAGGELDEYEVRLALTASALAAGLTESEAKATIDSGLGAGMTQPRQAPEQTRPRPQATIVAPPPQPADANDTDLGNAERIIARHGADLRYCHPWPSWLVWNGQHWQTDNTGEAVAKAKETLRALLAEANGIADDEKRKQRVRHVMRSEQSARIRGALELARSEPGIPVLPAQLDADPMRLNVANGTIDLETGKLQPHDRAQLWTKVAPCHFRPDAKAPRWHAFLERVLPDPELRAFVQRYVGYALTAKTGEQVLAIFWGGGANGKTTLIEAIRALLGDYGQQAPAETFLERRKGIPNDIARLRGARLVAATELAEGRRLNESLVKRMTGGDTMVARFMRGEWFEFPMTAKVVLATNHRPEIRGTDEAIWRRIRLVPFTVTIPPDERDENLPARLRDELPGILNWAVEGCLAWQRDGLGTADAVTTATAGYRNEMDTLGEFLEDCCTTADDAQGQAGALYTCFSTWAEQNGQRSKLTQQAFGRRLNERGFTQKRTNSTRWWLGLGIRDDSRVTDDAL